jgi:uncharacterized protein (DUF302 family)
MSDYFYTKIVDVNFEAAVDLVYETLKIHGFYIQTEIDIQKTLKDKLDINYKKYKILGAMHPVYFAKALEIDDKIGLLFPLNFTVQEHQNGNVEVSAISTRSVLDSAEIDDVNDMAAQIEFMINDIIDKI